MPATTVFTFQTHSSGFSGSPNNPTNLPVTYSIWFGDGNATNDAPDTFVVDSDPTDSSFPSFTHQYTECGNRSATVKAEVGLESALGTAPVNVVAGAEITASTTTVTVGGSVTFSASTEGNGLSNAYTWIFPDSTTQSGASASFTFNQTGTKTVTLNVTGGCNPSATRLITVTPDASDNQSFMKKLIVKVAPWSDAPPQAKDYLGSAVFLRANND